MLLLMSQRYSERSLLPLINTRSLDLGLLSLQIQARSDQALITTPGLHTTAVRLSRGGRQTGSTTMRVLPLLLLLDHHLGRTNGFHRPPRASKNPPLTSTAAPSQIGPSSLRSPKLRLDRINKFDQMVNEITLPETVIEFIDGDKQLLFRALNAGVREAEVLQAAAIVYEDLAPVRFGKVMLYPKSLKKRALLTHDARFSSTPTHSWRPNLRGALHHRHGRL